MKAKALVAIGLLALGGMAHAEGGCPQGQTPRLYGSVWGCAPGGTDGPGGSAGQGYRSYGYDYVPPPPVDDGWVNTYGAVAFGTKPGQGSFYWFEGSNRTFEDASSQALASCNKDGGQGCAIGGTAMNGFLGVSVSDDGSLFAAYSSREDGVDFAAVGKCKYEGHKEGCRFLKAQNFLRRRK